MAWTINGTPVSEFASVEWTLRNQAAGELKITRAVDGDVPAFWAYNTPIVLRDDGGAARWSGKILQPRESDESATHRRQLIAVSDGWAKLGRYPYLQDYPFDTYVGKSTRVLLAGTWKRVDVTDPWAERTGQAYETVIDMQPADCLATLVDAARQGGYAGADIGISGILPPQEADGIYCDAAIKAMMRWFPGSVGWVSADGQLHLKRASQLEPLDIDVSQITKYKIKERPDLVLPGCALHCRKVSSSEGGKKEDVQVFSAGDPTAEGALVQPVQLLPAQHALDIGNLVIGRFEDLHLDDASWWANYIPWIATALALPDKWGILGFTAATLDVASGVLDLGATPNIILRGEVKESWMVFGCAGPVSIRDQFVTTDTMPQSIPTVSPGTISTTVAYKKKLSNGLWLASEQKITLPIAFTNLSGTGRYAWEDPVAKIPGEDFSEFAGIPAQFLAETRHLQYQGQIEIATAELPDRLMGRSLNITGLDPAWANMRAPIHSVTQNVHTRRTTLTFGTAEYLGLADLVELMRAFHHPRPPVQRRTRFGLPPNPDLSGSGQSTNNPPTPPPGSGGQTAPSPVGLVRVTITPNPDALKAGAKYYMDKGDGTVLGPYKSDEDQSVPPGTYTVVFGPATGYIPPDSIDSQEVVEGTKLTVDATKSVYIPSSPAGAPWAVSAHNAGSADTPDWKALVSANSAILTSMANDGDKMSISGLTTPFAVSIGDMIYVTIHIRDSATDALQAQTATLNHGAAWSGSPVRVKIDSTDPANPWQSDLYLAVAQVVAQSDSRPGVVIGTQSTDPKVVQLLTTNVRLVMASVEGVVCLIPEASGGPIL